MGEITEALRRAASSPERRKRCGTRGRAIAEECFSWPDLAAQLEALFVSVLVSEVSPSAQESEAASAG